MKNDKYQPRVANECPRCGTPLPRVIYGYPNWVAPHELDRQGAPYVLGGGMVTFPPTRFSNRCVRCDWSQG
jgi:ribosomal protein S14